MPLRVGFAVGCVVLYVVLDLALRSLALPVSRIIPWYPPAGLAFSALVLAGPVVAVPLYLTRLALSLPFSQQPSPVWVTLLEAALQVLSYSAAAAYVRHTVAIDGRTWALRDAVRLSIGLLGAAVGAGVVSAATASIWRGQSWSIFWNHALSFAGGDASGALVIVPGVLLVLVPWSLRRSVPSRVMEDARSSQLASPDGGSPPSRKPNRRRAEHVAQALAVIATIGLGIADHTRSGIPYSFLCFAPLIWIALREGVRGAAIVIAAFGIGYAALGMWLGLAPGQLQYSQTLLIALGLTGLFVGAVRTSAVESDARYWHLVATANEAIWRLDPAGRTIHANARLATLLGCTTESLMGRGALEFIAPEERENWLAERPGRDAGLNGLYETTIVRCDGERRRVLASASQIRSATSGAVLGSVAMITDITPLRDAERQRNEAQHTAELAQALLDAAFRSARDAMVLFRAHDEMIIDVNEEWCRITGCLREEAIGRSQKDIGFWADSRDSVRVAQGIAEHGTVRDLEIAFHRRLPDGSGELGTAVLAAHPVWLEGTRYVLASGRDITEEKRAAQHRAQLQRLEELGRLAGGIAHDFSNLLTVVHSYAHIIRDSIDAGEPVDAMDALEIERAADRGRALTNRLQAFSRNQSVEVRPVDLNALLQAADGMLRSLLGASVTIHCALAADLPLILADDGQLDQVLLNFAVNARDAMGDAGELTLGTRLAYVAPGEAAAVLGADALPGEYVVLDVTDTGIGMDDAMQARIFEPFFSSKGAGRGTGLGLAVVLGIVRQAHGAVRVRSAPGRGTTFTVYWPAAPGLAATLPVPSNDVAA